jgi:alpha-galactosidase
LADGTLAVAFFNRGDSAADVSVSWSELGVSGKQSVRDLWREKEMGTADATYSVNVARHGAELFKFSPVK